MPTTIDPKYDELPEEAWKQIEEILETGACTLKSGRLFEFEEREYAGFLKWVAGLKPQSRRIVPKVEDFINKATQQEAS